MKLEFIEPQFDCDFTDDIVCPYCGHVHTDSWEMEPTDEEGDVDCQSCGKEFFLKVSTTKNYTSICNDKEPCEYIDDPSEAHPDHQICKRCGNTHFKRFDKK